MTDRKERTDQERTDQERRFYQHDQARPRLETRGEGDQAQRVIVGYAAVFYRDDDPGTEYELWQNTVERIMPGAFDAAKEDVVRGLTNHDPQWLLGRSDKGTLRLSVDKVGLRYEIDAPDTGAGRDTVALLDREDLDASSFAFRVHGKRGKVTWSEETRDGDTVEVREIHECELLDVGPATYPAYTSTEAGVRSEDPHLSEARADHRRWKEEAEPGPDPVGLEVDMATAIAGAARLLE